MLTPKDAILFKIVRTCAMTPIDTILFKIVHTCAKECLILKYKYVQNPWYYRSAYTVSEFYASNYAQVAAHYAIFQLCVKAAILATTISAAILWVL